MYKKLKALFERAGGQKLIVGVVLAGAVIAGWIDAAVAGIVSFFLMAKAIESQGILIAYSIDGSPSNFANVANVTGFKGPGGSASVIDVTNLQSVAKEKLMGLPDEGQFTIDINFDPDATSHQALQTARAARTRTEFRITFTDSTPRTAVFYGYVLGFEISGAVDQQVKASLTIEIDGAVAWA